MSRLGHRTVEFMKIDIGQSLGFMNDAASMFHETSQQPAALKPLCVTAFFATCRQCNSAPLLRWPCCFYNGSAQSRRL